MFLLNVTYKTKPGQKEAFVAAIKQLGIDAAFKAEKGCKVYDYYYPVDRADEVFLFEIWEDQGCQQAHLSTPAFAKLTALKNQFVESVTIDTFAANKL